jgi:hypothetical protein
MTIALFHTTNVNLFESKNTSVKEAKIVGSTHTTTRKPSSISKLEQDTEDAMTQLQIMKGVKEVPNTQNLNDIDTILDTIMEDVNEIIKITEAIGSTNWDRVLTREDLVDYYLEQIDTYVTKMQRIQFAKDEWPTIEAELKKIPHLEEESASLNEVVHTLDLDLTNINNVRDLLLEQKASFQTTAGRIKVPKRPFNYIPKSAPTSSE